MKTKSIAINTILNTFRMTLTILVPLVTYPYITRIFGSDGIGQYEWVKSVVSIFTLIASMGITTYAIREGAKVKYSREKFSKLAHELFFLNLCSTIVCYAILFALITYVPKFSMYRIYLLIYSVNIGLSALSLDWVYSVYEDYLYITVRQVIVQVVSIVGLFTLVHTKNDLIIYIIITTVSNSGANIFNFLKSRKYIDFKLQQHYDLLIHLVPVLVFFGTRFAMNAYNSIDTFILGMLSTNDSVGYYNAAVKINTILVTFFTAMSPVYLPRMMMYVTEKNGTQYQQLLKKVVQLKTMLMYPIVCGLFLFAPEIIWLIAGTGFEPAVFTLRILCFVLCFVLFSSIVQKDYMIPMGQEKTVLFLTVFAAVLNIAVSCALIVTVGYNGAAIGSLIAEATVFTIGAIIVRNEGVNLFTLIPKSSYKYFLSACVMSFACVYIHKVFLSSIAIIMIGIPLAAIIYFITLILLRDQFTIDSTKSLYRKIIKKR